MIDETVIDTRKKDKNVVIISEERYGEMEKAERNSVYLRKLDRGLTQVRAGHGVVKSWPRWRQWNGNVDNVNKI